MPKASGVHALAQQQPVQPREQHLQATTTRRSARRSRSRPGSATRARSGAAGACGMARRNCPVWIDALTAPSTTHASASTHTGARSAQRHRDHDRARDQARTARDDVRLVVVAAGPVGRDHVERLDQRHRQQHDQRHDQALADRRSSAGNTPWRPASRARWRPCAPRRHWQSRPATPSACGKSAAAALRPSTRGLSPGRPAAAPWHKRSAPTRSAPGRARSGRRSPGPAPSRRPCPPGPRPCCSTRRARRREAASAKVSCEGRTGGDGTGRKSPQVSVAWGARRVDAFSMRRSSPLETTTSKLVPAPSIGACLRIWLHISAYPSGKGTLVGGDP